MCEWLAQQTKDPQQKVAFPRELTLLKSFLRYLLEYGREDYKCRWRGKGGTR